MKKIIDIKKIYLHYIVKSSKLFILFISIFGFLFYIMLRNIELDVHTIYEASITDTEIFVRDKIPVETLENKVYVYTDKNQEILVLDIIAVNCTNEGTYLLLKKCQDVLSGTVTLEIITEKRSLLEEVFEVGIDNE